MSRTPYPPCVTQFCADRGCCAKGYKYEWSELVGKDWQYTWGVIEADNPLVTIILLQDGELGKDDFCCNRVYIHLDNNGNVRTIPLVG